jgi:hypothetical protein
MRGFLCLAQNNSTTDYVRLAYLQRMSCQLVSDLPYTLVTDAASHASMSSHTRHMFDNIIVLQQDHAQNQEWKQMNDWQLFDLSPYKQTIKMEADLLLTQPIDHWWRMLEKRDVVISSGCRDFRGDTATNRLYRKTFDLNSLPDLYTGLMYWRFSETAGEFFQLCRSVYANWHLIKQQLSQCDDPGSNDMVFAVAALIFGQEQVTIPGADFFNFAHMKPAINGLSRPWHREMSIELDPPRMRLNGFEQWYPVHYYEKEWATDDIIERYRRSLA